jgi:hypothetical protein
VGVKTFELYDKDFKMPSKSCETVPLIKKKIECGKVYKLAFLKSTCF